VNKTKKLILVVAFLFFGSTAQATLIDNGDGTITQIRSDGSALMWLQDANYAMTSGYDSDGKMTWGNANTWAGSLAFAGHSDWRLPWTLPVSGNDAYQFPATEVNGITQRYNSYDLNVRYDGSTDRGYNIDSLYSEMGYMFYEELGNLGFYEDSSGTSPTQQTGWGLSNMDLFVNLDKGSLSDTRWDNKYWSDIVYNDQNGSGLAWSFDFGRGLQNDYTIDINYLHAWAVRDSDLSELNTDPIPEPATVALLGIGLAGLAGAEVRRRRKREIT